MGRAAAVTALLFACAGSAHAHGRPAFVGALAFDPNDPQRVIARGTWGLGVSEDGGMSWTWSCAAAMGIDPTREDPDIIIAPDSALLLGGFLGLIRSDPEGCSYRVLPETADEYIIALGVDALDRNYAVLTSGIDPDRLLRSEDRGASFMQVGDPIAEILLERVVPAPSDPMRVYMSGALPRGLDGLRHGYLLRSTDGAASFEVIEIPLDIDERNVHVLAVDPTNPLRVFVRMVRRITDPMLERLILSEDGGDTWRTVANAHAFSSAAITPDGATVYAASSLDEGIFRSDDRGSSFALVQDKVSIYCLHVHEGALWACVDELLDGMSVGRSTDRGVSLEPMLSLPDMGAMIGCPACSPVGYTCPAWSPDVAFDLGLDAGGAGLPDGSITGLPRDASPPPICLIDGDAGGLDGGVTDVDAGGAAAGGGCGCRAAGSRSPGWLPLGLFVALVLRRRVS